MSNGIAGVFRVPAASAATSMAMGGGVEQGWTFVRKGSRIQWRPRYWVNVVDATTSPALGHIAWAGPWVRIYPHNWNSDERTGLIMQWGPNDSFSDTAGVSRTISSGISPLLSSRIFYEIDFMNKEFYAPFDCDLAMYGECPQTVAFDYWQDEIGTSSKQYDKAQEYTWTRHYKSGVADMTIPFPIGAHEFQITGSLPNNSTGIKLLYDDAGTGADGESVVALNFTNFLGATSGRIPIGNARAIQLLNAHLTASLSVSAFVRVG